MSSLWSKIGMENLDNEEYGTETKYKIPRWKYWLIEIGSKLLFILIGVGITILLYDKCLFNPKCNTVVTIYFAILGLTFFTQAGLSIDKVANIKLT